MPKMKTHRGAAKRLRRTGTGKFKRSKANKSHILGKKTAKRKRNLRQAGMIHKADERAIKEMLPGS